MPMTSPPPRVLPPLASSYSSSLPPAQPLLPDRLGPAPQHCLPPAASLPQIRRLSSPGLAWLPLLKPSPLLTGVLLPSAASFLSFTPLPIALLLLSAPPQAPSRSCTAPLYSCPSPSLPPVTVSAPRQACPHMPLTPLTTPATALGHPSFSSGRAPPLSLRLVFPVCAALDRGSALTTDCAALRRPIPHGITPPRCPLLAATAYIARPRPPPPLPLVTSAPSTTLPHWPNSGEPPTLGGHQALMAPTSTRNGTPAKHPSDA